MKMHGLESIDIGRTIDWGKTSSDYAAYRPGPPDDFYARLAALGVGVANQRILDLGTGTGVLARQFAAQASRVSAVDISSEQIDIARCLAKEQGVAVDFQRSPAEDLPFEGGTFDVATANQCWLYFDRDAVLAELARVLKPGGWISTSHFSWLPRRDDVARQSEALVLKHNPQWSAADWAGEIPAYPEWAQERLRVRAMFYYDASIYFTRESWRGRIRACRGIGASLNQEQVDAFDREHAELLRKIVPETFTVLHRIDAHIYEFKT